MKVSIIVPVYNAEKSIRFCLDSLIHQTYKDIEILVINDGSVDSTKDILDTYQDDCLKIMHVSNGGVSKARNLGLDCCSGQYIMFVDADDYLDLHAVECLVGILHEHPTSIVQFGFLKTNTYHETTKEMNYKLEAITGREANLRLVSNGSEPYSIVCNKIYPKEIFQTLRFKEGIRYEDEDILYVIYDQVEHVYSMNRVCYFYYQHADSFMNSTNTHTLDFVDVFARKYAYFQDKDLELALKTMNVFCYALFHTYASTNDKTIRKQVEDIYKKYRAFFLKNPYIQGFNKLAVLLSCLHIKFLDLYRLKHMFRRGIS